MRTWRKRSVAPLAVYREAHRQYPNAVGTDSLYGVAFFGHSRPRNLDHLRTTESIWRGLLRKCLQQHIHRIISGD